MPSLELPGILAVVAIHAGEGAALRLAEAKGGAPAYIPRPGALDDGHWLVKAVGQKAAWEIASIYGGEEIEIPLGPFAGCRNRVRAAIRAAMDSGASAAQAARLAGVHIRTVRRQKNGRGEFRDDQHRLI